MAAAALKQRVKCRPISEADLEPVAELLTTGFEGRSIEFWRAGLNRMANRPVPEGARRFGYCLDTGSRIVGVLLLIAATRIIDGDPAVFCNVGSWYVVPDFRAYAQLLVSVALRNKDFTYTNVSPAPHTWDIVEQQGYSCYCSGLFLAAAALKPPRRGVAIERFDPSRHGGVPNADLLQRHAELGCDVVVAREGQRLTGMIFSRFRIRSGRVPLPAMFVLHAPDRDYLVSIAGNLGWHFIRKAAPFLVMDANGPVAGLVGHFTAKHGRKYYKGPHRPRLSDLADTEYVIFGV